jgi:hypothetical protein
MEKDNGGNAFPSKEAQIMYTDGICEKCLEKIAVIKIENQGMTLRDYFAGQALIPLIESTQKLSEFPIAVEQAYIIADEMLSERKKKVGGK